METMILENSLTDWKVDALIVLKEQEVIVLYQEVLAQDDIPNTTDAILQSQAEELNNLLQGLKTDLRIKTRAKAK